MMSSVAEMAEKPLYRVTCDDIGTKPEDVEQVCLLFVYIYICCYAE